jgi:hypothetical protein
MFAVYFISRKNSDDSEPFITRMINGYTESSEKWSKRNDLHVRMIEQAGEDRVLFMNTTPHDHVNMKFPEYVGPYPYICRFSIELPYLMRGCDGVGVRADSIAES